MSTTTHPPDFLDFTPSSENTLKDEPPVSIRQLFGDNLPFSKDEKLPRTLCLPQGQPLLMFNPDRGGYALAEEIDMWLPVEHLAMLATIRQELREESYPHATGLGRHRGCKGPLCRRYRRQIEFESAALTSEKLRIKREERAKKDGTELQTRVSRISNTPFERLQVAKPQMAAVDPLIVVFCIKEYENWYRNMPRGYHKPWHMAAFSEASKRDFLAENYGNYVK